MPETRMIHVRFPAGIVEQMTAYLKDRGVNRNFFIVEAVVEKLRREVRAKAFRETRGVLAPEDAPEWTALPAAEWVERLREKEMGTSSWDT